MNSRRDTQGNHCRFNQQCSRSAHRINKGAFAPPSRFQNHAGSQHFVQRSFGLCHTISAFVQRFARTVERERTGFVGYMDIEHQIGIADAYRGAFAVFFHKIVGYGIFHPISDKFGVGKNVRINYRIHSESFVDREVFVPIHFFHFIIHLIGIFGFEGKDGFQYSQCSAAMYICFIH